MSGLSFKAQGTFDAQAVAARLSKAAGNAQKALDAQVLNDSNFYCPMKTSALQKSAQIYTRIGSGEVVWKTPYAKAQYYGENFDHSKQNNPNACAKWFEAAKARWSRNWVRLVDEGIRRG